jgi:DUF2924 family protein
MKRDQSEAGFETLASELARLRSLDGPALKRRWRALYASEPPARISPSLLLHAVGYRLQEKALGGLKPSTRRLLERVAQDSAARPHSVSAPAGKLKPGTVLVREWRGATHQVTVLDDGVMLRGERYRSLSEVARRITGSRWSGPLFFGLRSARAECSHGAH